MQNAKLPDGLVTSDAMDLISEIYDAAIRPEIWPRVLEGCRQFVGGASAAIFAKTVTGNWRRLYFDDGRLDVESRQAYFNHLAPLDPSNTVQVFAEVEDGVITSQKLLPEDFVLTRFAREWALPQGLVDIGFATLERRGDGAALFGVFRHERDGLGDEAMRQKLALLAPHVRRSFAIGNTIGQARHTADSFRNLFDGLAAAVFLVDADGRLVHANFAGEALIGRRDGAIRRRQDGVLHLERGDIRRLLPQDGDVEPRSTCLETTAGERLIVHVLPMTGAIRSVGGTGGDVVAALFVQAARFDPPSISETLGRTFELTPAELRVALATLRNDRVADVAEDLGIAEPTVKTHLSRIFAKTDTKRQADIVKLIAALASPLAPR